MDEQHGKRIAACANTIAAWLGMRDVSALEPAALEREAQVGGGVADLFVLFGGGVVGSIDVLAQAMRTGVARHYAIVGGRGHATYGLEKTMRAELASWDPAEAKGLDPASASEAEMLAALLAHRHGVAPSFLETRSTNCGNNITYLLDLLDADDEPPTSVVLSQDATMQRRMVATWELQVATRPRYAQMQVVSWATYQTSLVWDGRELAYEHAPEGMWDVERYLSLLMGDVSRLTDDEHGYGPKGAGFITHVDVPEDVTSAWNELKRLRPADARVL